MVVPTLSSRVEQGDKNAVQWVQTGEVWPFVLVAIRTREAKVLDVIGAPVLSRNDVLDVERCEFRVHLPSPTILAPIFRPLANVFPSGGVHLSPVRPIRPLPWL